MPLSCCMHIKSKKAFWVTTAFLAKRRGYSRSNTQVVCQRSPPSTSCVRPWNVLGGHWPETTGNGTHIVISRLWGRNTHQQKHQSCRLPLLPQLSIRVNGQTTSLNSIPWQTCLYCISIHGLPCPQIYTTTESSDPMSTLLCSHCSILFSIHPLKTSLVPVPQAIG